MVDSRWGIALRKEDREYTVGLDHFTSTQTTVKAKEARDKERGDRAETEQPPPAVDSIIGMTEPRAGERMFIVKYADSSVEILPVVEAYDRYPKEVSVSPTD